VQVAQLQARGDGGEHVLVEEFHAQHQRRLGVRIGRGVVGRDHRHRRDDGGPAEKRLQAHRAMRACGLRRPGIAAGAAAHQVEDRLDVRANGVEPVRVDAAVAERGEQEAVGGVGDEHEVVVEEGLQPQADIGLDPFGVEADPDPAVGDLGGGDAPDLAQHPLALIGKRAREQLALGVERHLVGALRGAEHRDHDADDGYRNDDADRHHDAEPHVVPTESLASFADARGSHYQMSALPGGVLLVLFFARLEGKSE
jgi:hypothetical protein